MDAGSSPSRGHILSNGGWMVCRLGVRGELGQNNITLVSFNLKDFVSDKKNLFKI